MQQRDECQAPDEPMFALMNSHKLIASFTLILKACVSNLHLLIWK